MDNLPAPDTIYRMTHSHDGTALVYIISMGDVFAMVEMVDELESTYQIAKGVRFKAVIAQCQFELSDA